MVTRRGAIRTLATVTAASTISAIVPRAVATPHAVDDSGAASVHELIGTAPPWSCVTITRNWSVVDPVVLAAPITLRFAGGSLSTPSHISLLHVFSSDVRIEQPVLRGADGSVSGLGRGIQATGTTAAPLRNVVVHGGSISGQSHDGVLLEHVEQFAISGTTITDVGYAGVLLVSCTDGLVSGNRIDQVNQPAPYVNSYGIEAARSTAAGIDRFPRSARITVSDNWVSRVPAWEGIDTHGGEQIAILRNRVEDCRVGIALVPSKDEDDASKTKYAPLSCSVIGNTVTRSFRGPGPGIVVRGAGETIDSPAERATGVLLGNAVSGYGDADRDAPVLVYLTRDLVIAENDLVGFGRAISAYHSNADLTIFRNSVVDVQRLGTARTAGILVVATANSGTVFGNQVSAGDVGLQCRSATNSFLSIGNSWGSLVTDPVVSATDAVVRFRDG